MKILSITVDQLPAGCGECPLMVDIGGDSYGFICAGLAEGERSFPSCSEMRELSFRRHDCPLRVNPYSLPPFPHFCEPSGGPLAKEEDDDA